MKATLKNLTGLACMFLVVGSISACSTTVAPEDSATTEYVFQQTKNTDQVLSKDDSMTSGKVEGD
jgi:hypothetical protein